MLNNIDYVVNEVKKHPVSKDEVVKRLDEIEKHLDDVLEQLSELITVGGRENKVVEKNKILQQLNIDAELKAKDNVGVIRKIHTIFKDIKDSKRELDRDLILKLPNTIDYKSLTYRDATILEFLNQVEFLITYTVDICLMSLVSDDSDNMSLGFTKQYTQEYTKYAKYLRYYSKEMKNVIKDLNKVSTQFIDPEHVESNNTGIIENVFKQTGKFLSLPHSTGFLGNPVYHFRMWLADRSHKQYELKKEKVKLLELKILKLKMDKDTDGVNINKINKQIEYYQSKVDDLTYDIVKYEKE